MDFEKQVHEMCELLKDVRWLTGPQLKRLADDLVRTGWSTDLVLTLADSIANPAERRFFIDRYWYALQFHGQILRNGPPRSVKFILLLVPKRNREHLIGDLEEEFQTIVLPQYGRFLARCWYFEQVMLAIGFYLWPTIKKILRLSVLYKLIGR
jgi:hypothetical protein